jgi:hypothetical protein
MSLSDVSERSSCCGVLRLCGAIMAHQCRCVGALEERREGDEAEAKQTTLRINSMASRTYFSKSLKIGASSADVPQGAPRSQTYHAV